MKNNIVSIKLVLLFLSLVFVAFGCNKITPSIFSSGMVQIAGVNLSVEIAQTEEARMQGLSGRESLAENQGMLFQFPQAGRYAFWMKDMKFPLDFIWIKDNKVVEITHNVVVEPNISDAELHMYLPQEEIDSMIEVNAGWAEKNKVRVGDSVRLTK